MIEIHQTHERKIVKTYNVLSWCLQNEDCMELETENFGQVIVSREDNPEIWQQVVQSSMAETPYVPHTDIVNEAMIALDKSDKVALRCLKAGIAFPPEWRAYVVDLRSVINGQITSLPVQPDYPQGS